MPYPAITLLNLTLPPRYSAPPSQDKTLHHLTCTIAEHWLTKRYPCVIIRGSTSPLPYSKRAEQWATVPVQCKTVSRKAIPAQYWTSPCQRSALPCHYLTIRDITFVYSAVTRYDNTKPEHQPTMACITITLPGFSSPDFTNVIVNNTSAEQCVKTPWRCCATP